MKKKTDGDVPEKVFVEFTNSDKSWSTGKTLVEKSGEVIDVILKQDTSNLFSVTVSDEKGNLLDCEPESFTIFQGSKIGSATLPYHYGVEIKSRESGKIIFEPIKGLKKSTDPCCGNQKWLKNTKGY